MEILSNLLKVTQQTDGELGVQPMMFGLEACDLNHKTSGSESVAPRQAAPSLSGNSIELQVPGPYPRPTFFFFLAALSLCCCMRAFSSCSEWGLLFVAVQGLLIAVASLVAEHGSRHVGFSSCGTQAQ